MEALTKQSLAIDSSSPPEQILELIEASKRATANLRAAKAAANEVILDWLEANGNSLERGEVRYYSAPVKRIKARSLDVVAEAVLEATGGDWVAFCESLSTSAFKQGAVKKLVGDNRWAELFSVEVVQELKTGKAKRKLAEVNERFVR